MDRVVRYLLVVFLLFVLVVGGLAAFAWQRTGRDRYAALEQQGVGLAGVLRGAALEARGALRTAEEALAARLQTVARRIDDALTVTRRPSADVLQELADEEGASRVFLFDADLQPVSRARSPAALPGGSGGLITAEQKVALEWGEATDSVRALQIGPGEWGVEGLHTNVFGTRKRFGVALGRPEGGILLLRANADEIAAIRRRFGVEPLLERAVELPDVLTVLLTDAAGHVLLGVGSDQPEDVGLPAAERGTFPVALTSGDALRVVDPLDDARGVWLDLRLSRARADAAVQASRRLILWGGIGALLVATLALLMLRRMETRFQRARALGAARLEEERRLAELGAFTGLITHELSNPLNALRLGVRLLSDSQDSNERARVLETMRTESDRVTRRLEEFLRLAAAPSPRRQRIDGAILDRVAERTSEAARERDVRVVTRTAPRDFAAAGDPVVIEEALLNLVRNAIEATPPQGDVELTCEVSAEGKACLRITDDGPGFEGDPADLLRFGGATKRRGHGLGLVLARRFIEGHGGRLMLSNGASGGACVEVVLPAWEVECE